MKQLSKQIDNAEARFAVLEEQMSQNVKDHGVILNEVRHNCRANQDNFQEIKDLINQSLDEKANKWVEWAVKMMLAGFFTALIGLLIAINK